MQASPVPADILDQAHQELLLRHDSVRNAVLRTLYAWFNLTLLLSFGWPALVVFFEAPLASVENTPADWFFLRIGVPLVVLGVAIRLWYGSAVPVFVGHPKHLAHLRTIGPVWTQSLIFIVLLAGVLSAVLFASDQEPAAKVLSFGLVEAAAMQVAVSGYVKSALEAVGAAPSRSFWVCAVLFGAMFTLRGGVAAGIQPDAAAGLVFAGSLAGFAAGFMLGAATIYLRDRLVTIYPGIILQWLVVAMIPAVVG